jgi:hypothetical protein
MEYRPDAPPEAPKKAAAASPDNFSSKKRSRRTWFGHATHETAASDSAIPFPDPPTSTGRIADEAPASLPPLSRNGEMEQVGGPVSAAWREGTLTRAKELESLCAWVVANTDARHNGNHNSDVLARSVYFHIDAARDAARVAALDPKKRLHLLRYGPLRERAMSNLDAAEAQLLNIAPAGYVLGQMPSLLQHIRCHLVPGDQRREDFELLARRLGVNDPPLTQTADQPRYEEKKRIVERERGQIVTAVRAASSASLREQVRVRSFRNVLLVTTAITTLLAIGVAITGWLNPTLIPLCFAPEEAGQAIVVCPTQQSAPFSTTQSGTTPAATTEDIDDAIGKTATRWDLLVVELVGLTAAALAATAAIRRLKGSSERYGLPVALAALKLPTGAITAFLGLLLMRGQFVPGLSALDTSAQILAWALVFGYAQQVFTRLVDQQGQNVLNSVRGADRPQTNTSPP